MQMFSQILEKLSKTPSAAASARPEALSPKVLTAVTVDKERFGEVGEVGGGFFLGLKQRLFGKTLNEWPDFRCFKYSTVSKKAPFCHFWECSKECFFDGEGVEEVSQMLVIHEVKQSQKMQSCL